MTPYCSEHPALKILSPSDVAAHETRHHLADCVVITQNNKILLQKRPKNWRTFPGTVNLFGGHVETLESPIDGMIRELREELGAQVITKDVVYIGALTEAATDHLDIVHVYFWRDEKETITGCYEGAPFLFESVCDALNEPDLMEYSAWALKRCHSMGLLA